MCVQLNLPHLPPNVAALPSYKHQVHRHAALFCLVPLGFTRAVCVTVGLA